MTPAETQTFARGILDKIVDYPHGSDPHGMVDQFVIDKLVAILRVPVIEAAAVKEVLDDVVHGSLATGIIVTVLDAVWRALLDAPTAA